MSQPCKCDCIGHEPGGRPVIQFCPLHAAAPGMLAALEEYERTELKNASASLQRQVRAAIAKAKIEGQNHPK